MSTISNPTQAAQAHKKELAEQLRQQQADKEKIEADHNTEMERLKNAYSTEKAANQDRFESSVQTERLTNYENLRKIKKQAETSEETLNRLKNERINQLQNRMAHDTVKLEQDGEKSVQDVMKKNAAMLEHTHKEALAAENLTRTLHKNTAESIIKNSEEKIGKIQEQKTLELNQHGARHHEAVSQIKSQFENNTNQVQTQYRGELKRIQDGTQQDLNQRRLQNSQQLSAYSARQEDPFYQMVRFDSQFTDLGDRYELRLNLPAYEKDRFKVQVSGQELQISGTRSTNEKAEVKPGHWVSTSSFQNFTERLPLPIPVDAKTLGFSEEGNERVYTVMKYGPNHKQGALELAKSIDQKAMRVAQPDFPQELPTPSIIPNRTNKAMT